MKMEARIECNKKRLLHVNKMSEFEGIEEIARMAREICSRFPSPDSEEIDKHPISAMIDDESEAELFFHADRVRKETLIRWIKKTRAWLADGYETEQRRRKLKVLEDFLLELVLAEFID